MELSLGQCRIIELPKIADPRGNLTFLEADRHVPFGIKRVFYLYDVPGGADRGGHALKSCHQFLIAMSGSFDVIVYNGKDKTFFTVLQGELGALEKGPIDRKVLAQKLLKYDVGSLVHGVFLAKKSSPEGDCDQRAR